MPPIDIIDSDFSTEDWTVTAEATVGATYTVTQQVSGGFGGGPFRFMSHHLPPVTGNDLAVIAVTHVFEGASYDPGIQGPITAIDYQEAGIILSFPFPQAFSTTQPVIEQDGRIYRFPEVIRFIAQNSSHNWEIKSLDQLIAADFIAIDGSGDHPDFSASGSPILIGFTRTNSRGSTQPPMPGLDLTERERVVLALMVEGLNNTQIAGRLVVSPSTIKTHVSNILAKLGVASRSEAVALALRSGLVA